MSGFGGGDDVSGLDDFEAVDGEDAFCAGADVDGSWGGEMCCAADVGVVDGELDHWAAGDEGSSLGCIAAP